MADDAGRNGESADRGSPELADGDWGATDDAPPDRRAEETSPFSSPEGRRILQVVVGTMVGAGLLVGATSFLLGTVGTPELSVEPSRNLGRAGRGLVDEYQRKVDRTVLSYATVKAAQFLAVGLAAGLGVHVGTSMAGDRRTKLLATAIGSVIGATGLVVVAGILGTIGLPTFAVPFERSVVTVTVSVRVDQLVRNAALVGAMAGIASAGGVTLGRRRRDDPGSKRD